MIRIIFLLLTGLLFMTSATVSAQSKISKNQTYFRSTKYLVCHGSDEVHHHYVPAKKRAKSKNPMQIIPLFSDNIPRGVEDLISNGLLPLVSETFSSNVPVRIAFFWSSDVGEGTLAGAAPTSWYRNLPGQNNAPAFPLTNVWYPVPLAEKLMNRQLNDPNEADISVTINAEADWYTVYSQPENVGNKYDLLSTLLHEVYHGLGYIAGLGVTVTDEGNGVLSTGGAVGMFGYDMVNGNGVFLRDVVDNSNAMAAELQSNNLYYRIGDDENNQARLYAPSTFEQGSSISHLNEFTYNSTESSLMTPVSSRGEVERSAGVADSMLYNMGWVYTSILHEAAEPVENVDVPYNLSVEVISDLAVEEGSVTLHYSDDQFANTTSVEMDTKGDGTYTAVIPATGEERVVDYYFSAKDAVGKEYTSPGQAPTYSFQYVFAIDDSIPRITHTELEAINNVDVSFDISADISDFFTGVDTAYVEYRVNGVDQTPAGMSLMALDSFSAPVYFTRVPLASQLSTSDMLEYRIVAIDKSNAKNQAVYPENGGYISVGINEVSAAVDKYYNNFHERFEEFTLDRFTQERIDGFGSSALHTEHPYTNAGEGNAINYTAELNIPIRIASVDPLIIFEEIVLVENGDPGVPFGRDEFWDYVIVEGKKLGTSDWLPFLDGYDCRANPVWLNTYVGGIPSGQQNSTGVGTEAMMRKRTIDMTASGDFVAGDEILIRFRMLSDPFATGWGWAIDNLSIQDATTAVEDYVSEEKYTISPSPAKDRITIDISLEKSAPNARLSMIDALGNKVMDTPLRNKSKRIKQDIDVSHLPSGVYFVKVAFNEDDVITKRIVKTQ